MDRVGFHIFALFSSFLWFVLLWGLRLSSVTAGLALYFLILLLRRKIRDDRLVRKEKRLRVAIGGELALERLVLSEKERAHFETAMLLSMRYPLTLLQTGEEGTLCDRRGQKLLITFIQMPASASVGAAQVLDMQRAVRLHQADRGLLCVPCCISGEARVQAKNQPEISFLSREQLISLFGQANPATDEQLVALGRRKKAQTPVRILRVVLDRGRARRYACYGILLLLMYQFAPLLSYAAAGLVCVFLAAACRCVRENDSALFE